MDQLKNFDEFSSIFRRSMVPQFQFDTWKVSSACLIVDQNSTNSQSVIERLKTFSPALAEAHEWKTIQVDKSSTVESVEQQLAASLPDLIVTWRHLCETQMHPHHSLGVYVDVLTQVVPRPILLLPGECSQGAEKLPPKCQNILIATDHAIQESRLIHQAVAMGGKEASIILGHVEDDLSYQRYLQAIERIPEINTEIAAEKLLSQLLHDADRFGVHVAEQLAEQYPDLTLKTETMLGHRVQTFRKLVESQQTDLLVMNTKDQDQLAMHGLAYSLSIELRDIAQLLV